MGITPRGSGLLTYSYHRVCLSARLTEGYVLKETWQEQCHWVWSRRRRQQSHQAATQSHHHPDDCVLSWAASHNLNDKHSWSVGHTHIPSGCLCTTGHFMGQWSQIVYLMASPVYLWSILFCPCVSSLETGLLSVWVFVKPAHALSVSRLGA